MDFSSDTLPCFVLTGLENDVKGAFHAKTLPFRITVKFRINVEVHVLKNVLKQRESIFYEHVLFFIYLQKIIGFKYFCVENIFIVQVQIIIF